MKIWILTILIIFISCLPTTTLHNYQYTHLIEYPGKRLIAPVYLDINFVENDKVEIAHALDQWNYVLNGYLRFEIIDASFDMKLSSLQDDQAFFFFSVNSDNPLVQEVDLAGRDHGENRLALGFTPSIGSHYIYLVRNRLESTDVFYLAMHEMGHALGATHNGRGLMYPHYTQLDFQCVDQLTILKVAKYQSMDVQYLNYCY